MKAHTDEQFSAFMSQLKETNQTLDFSVILTRFQKM